MRSAGKFLKGFFSVLGYIAALFLLSLILKEKPPGISF